jgi:adenylylsulfate kinase
MKRSGSGIDRAARQARNGHGSAVVWLTGLPGAGKSTIATAVESSLFARGVQVYGLDGDDLRRGISRDLKFSPEDRSENLRRASEIAALFADAGMVALASFIAPYRRERALARALAAPAPFIEVFVDCPLEECVRRDPKGLYKRALAGELLEFTGISAPYEPPEDPEVHLRTDHLSIADSAAKIITHLEASGVLAR